jgi:hypothetical protein
VIKIGTAQWTVSRARLQSTSAIFRKELLNSSVKVFENADWEPSAFELFLQWLYTERYQEFDGYAPVFKIDEEYSSLERQTEMTSENMPWGVKAAILAHKSRLGPWCSKFHELRYAEASASVQTRGT